MTDLSFGVLGTARIAEAFMHAACVSSRARAASLDNEWTLDAIRRAA